MTVAGEHAASDSPRSPDAVNGQRALLVTLTGRDRPGVTSALFSELADFSVVVLDAEQIVLRGRLILVVQVAIDAGAESELLLRDRLAELARELGLEVEVSVAPDESDALAPAPLHVTVLAPTLTPTAMASVAQQVRDSGANIDRIQRLAREPVTCIELEVSGADPGHLRSALSVAAARAQIDVAVQRSGLYRRAKRLVVMDVDSTLNQGEVIEMLAERAGCGEAVRAVTDAAMRGELDFESSL